MNPTICAISTPPGSGGIAIIRLSGPEAISYANKIFMPKKELLDSFSTTALYS